MKFVLACLLVLAVAGCAEQHELTACKGPYNALTPPPPALPSPAQVNHAQVQAVR